MYAGKGSIQKNGLETLQQYVNLFEPTSACNFIPVQLLVKKCAHCVLDGVDICGVCRLFHAY